MDTTVQTRVYNGALLTTNLLASQQTIVLGSFGAVNSGVTLTDDNAKATVGETIALNGSDYVVVGSGTAQPGVNLLGLTVPLGTAKDMILVQSVTTGQLTFIFPDGLPSATGMIALVIDVDPIGYDLVDKAPLCFAAGTRILTEKGYRSVEELVPGDLLMDAEGGMVPLLWKGTLEQPLVWERHQRHRPIEIAADTFGRGLPERPLRLSPQHRVSIRHPRFRDEFGSETVLVPVKYLLNGECITEVSGLTGITYHHLLCARHCLLVAEGMPAESLLQGPMAVEAMSKMPDVPLRRFSTVPCLPVLKRRDLRQVGYHFEPAQVPA
ncbi:Hint domain-containing protein [Phaeovulum sp. W22_SRMD_FR3]|uniref:Hint domain-containing protein n=1 Tax=Phaeovulum sp. W22_SRMD_FR3 TaxID=3240274 RepID=UPI003F96290F